MLRRLKTHRDVAKEAERLAEELQKSRAELAKTREKLSAKDERLGILRGRLERRDERIARLTGASAGSRPTYDADNMRVWNKNTAFLEEPRFVEAYARAMDSGQWRKDLHIEWRVHVLCWAARHALALPGDFVECGVNTGMFSLAVAHYVDFNATGKRFYLFDTFEGIPEEQISEEERALNIQKKNQTAYKECYELAKANFEPYPNARLVRGRVPETLSSVDIGRVCYLSIDMNIVAPEVAAIEHFWGRLVPGAPVILDDYGFTAHAAQKRAMDEFAAGVGREILTLPTGQGLLLKPPCPQAEPARIRNEMEV